MGSGRHALPLALAGYRVFGVDRDVDAVRTALDAAAVANVTLRAWCADLSEMPFPDSRFDLVVVTRYLQRNLFASLRRTVARGGVVLYETFTTRQRALGWGPTSPEHLLDPGELRQAFDTLEILFSEEVEAPEAVARVAARR